MVDFVTLSCPSCGGKLEITKDIDRFACGHCGNEHVVNRVGSVVSIKPIVENIQQIAKSSDKTASELAIARLKEEIETIQGRLETNCLDLKKVGHGATEFYFAHIKANKLKAVQAKDRFAQIKNASIEELVNTIGFMNKDKYLSRDKAKGKPYCKDLIYQKTLIEDKRKEVKRYLSIVNSKD